MFGLKNQSYIPYLSRMQESLNRALIGSYSFKRPCADEIRPMLKSFYDESCAAVTKKPGSDVPGYIENIFKIAQYLARNTRNYEKLNNEDITSLKKIFAELESLHAEALKVAREHSTTRFFQKIECISEIVCKNMVNMHDTLEEHDNYRDGMIFQNYENLWEVIHLINTDWDTLVKSGFSLKVFYDFRESVDQYKQMGKEKTEKEKFEDFMGLIYGTKKFVTLFRPVGYAVVEKDFEGAVYDTISGSKYLNPYSIYSGNFCTSNFI